MKYFLMYATGDNQTFIVAHDSHEEALKEWESQKAYDKADYLLFLAIIKGEYILKNEDIEF